VNRSAAGEARVGALAHVRRLWPGASLALILPFVLWIGGSLVIGHGRWEHVAVLCLVIGLALGNAATKKLLLGLYPIGLLALVYDSMGLWKTVGITAASIHVCDLRALEMRFFGVDVDGVRGTAQDWFQAHSSTALDVYCAIPYGTFIFVTCGFAVFLYRRDYAAMRRFGWTFLIVNLVGFATYHLYPAAPPWYFHAHGCTVDMAAHASEGPNLARVDAMMGIRYFAGFYGRSNDVFGAVPSLHVAYPCLVVLFGWPLLRVLGRALALLFLASMCLSAVYLDHHWIIDVLLGLVYTVTTYAVVTLVSRRRDRVRATALEPART
jgi:hypothetical protein